MKKNKIKICPECGKEFVPLTARKEYCSKECMQHHYYMTKTLKKRKAEQENNNDKTYIKICPTCGKEFIAKHKARIYCSDRCLNPLKEKIKKICVHCGKEFETAKLHQKYCSQECAVDSIIEKSETKYKEKVCPVCGKTFTGHFTRKYCSDECIKEKKRKYEYEKYHNSK